MKDLEKLVKDSFEGFEPEVSPKIWEKLQHGLDGAAASTAASQGSAVVKGVAIKGSTIAWISGSIITAGLSAMLLLSDSTPENKIVSPVETPSEVNTPQSDAAENTITVGQEATISDTETAAEKSPEISKTSQNENAVSERPAVFEAEVHDSPPGHSQQITDKQAEGKTVNTDGSSVKDAQQSSGNQNESQVSDLDKGIPTGIIVNGTCGFAPFKVVGLLNNENLKGDWDFGDGYATASTNSTSHTYNAPGTYTLKCTTGEITIERTIEVVGIVASAFTPNGDGWNDEFFIDAPSLEELRLKIFDRKGQLEYEIMQPGQRWDGKNKNGKDLPSGTYFYDIFARSNNGQTITQKGTINIFR